MVKPVTVERTLLLACLGLVDDLAKVAFDDELGRKLQDIQLLKKK